MALTVFFFFHLLSPLAFFYLPSVFPHARAVQSGAYGYIGAMGLPHNTLGENAEAGAWRGVSRLYVSSENLTQAGDGERKCPSWPAVLNYVAKHGGKAKIVRWGGGGLKDAVDVTARGQVGAASAGGATRNSWLRLRGESLSCPLPAFYCTCPELDQRKGGDRPSQEQLLHLTLVERHHSGHLALPQRSVRRSLLSKRLILSPGHRRSHTFSKQVKTEAQSQWSYAAW